MERLIKRALMCAMLLLSAACSEKKVPEQPTPDVATLTSIEISSLPEKRVYTLGETLDTKGLVLSGKYSDSSTRPIVLDKASISGFDSSVAAKSLTLTVTFNSVSTTFTVEILPIKATGGVLEKVDSGVESLTLPSHITAIANEAFRASDIKTIVFNEGLQTIGEKAFARSKIESARLPASLREIGLGAFYGCQQLRSVDLSATQLTTIPDECFVTASVSQVSLPATIKHIGSQAFLKCTQLQSITLPAAVTHIADEAFRESGITDIALPNSLYSIASRAFYLCADLASVTTFGQKGTSLPEPSLLWLGTSAFEGCDKLARLEIPESIATIGQNIVIGSPALTSITIPSGVVQIAFSAFSASSLRTVTLLGTTPPRAMLVSGVWYGFPQNVESINVPPTTSALYKSAEGWSEFASKIKE